jgi:hypothetical protein
MIIMILIIIIIIIITITYHTNGKQHSGKLGANFSLLRRRRRRGGRRRRRRRRGISFFKITKIKKKQ